MALFSRRDRTAIAIIGLLILVGWGIRFGTRADKIPGDLQVIRHAAEPPPLVQNPDTLLSGDGIPDGAVNINTAGKEELEKLPLIGPSRAAAIIAYRDAHGRFRRPEDIRRVTGIGAGIYEGIRRYITVTDSTGKGE
ncbi:ComEA family DNA-binding protein [bacterium]|nr:ComEA family DNA-binding protein [bacterium]